MTMISNPIGVIALMFVAYAQPFGCSSGSGNAAHTDGGKTAPVYSANDHERLVPVLSAAKANGVSVWIEYHGSCAPHLSNDVPFGLTVNSDTKGGTAGAVSAIRDVVRDDKGVSVSALRPGLIGIKSKDVWSSGLQAKLVDLKLTDSDRYNPNYAIWAGMNASAASQQALRASPVPTVDGGLGELPSKGRPHLKASARYETLANLLDDIAATFPGVLVYKECSRPDGTHLFNIDYYRTDQDASSNAG